MPLLCFKSTRKVSIVSSAVQILLLPLSYRAGWCTLPVAAGTDQNVITKIKPLRSGGCRSGCGVLTPYGCTLIIRAIASHAAASTPDTPRDVAALSVSIRPGNGSLNGARLIDSPSDTSTQFPHPESGARFGSPSQNGLRVFGSYATV